jgi:hypothetical protein
LTRICRSRILGSRRQPAQKKTRHIRAHYRRLSRSHRRSNARVPPTGPLPTPSTTGSNRATKSNCINHNQKYSNHRDTRHHRPAHILHRSRNFLRVSSSNVFLSVLFRIFSFSHHTLSLVYLVHQLHTNFNFLHPKSSPHITFAQPQPEPTRIDISPQFSCEMLFALPFWVIVNVRVLIASY